jgi:hypothetical protein
MNICPEFVASLEQRPVDQGQDDDYYCNRIAVTTLGLLCHKISAANLKLG